MESSMSRHQEAACGMARITYFDLEGAAPRVTWRGVPFRDGEAVVLDDARHAELIDQASTHPWFSVDRDDAADADEPEASALEAAAEFLTRALANGPVPQAAVMADANASGISTATLRRAKAKLGVEAVKQGMDGGWFWALPAQAASREPASAEDAQPKKSPGSWTTTRPSNASRSSHPPMSLSLAGSASATTPRSSSTGGAARPKGWAGACLTCSDQIPLGRWLDMIARASSGRCKAKPSSS